MNLLKKRILQVFPDWNQRVHTEAEAEEYCIKRGIVRIDTDLIDDLGEYRVYKGKPFIMLHKFVTNRNRSWVLTHEVGHDILHSPLSCKFSTGTRLKIEKEANIFSAVFLIPRFLVEMRSLAEIEEEYSYPRDVIMIRKWLYDSFDRF
jgi:Zn-dependent peptidase ImmA (M78 family)